MEEDESVDKLDSITLFFTDSGKSRRQVARKLKEMSLIQVWLANLTSKLHSKKVVKKV